MGYKVFLSFSGVESLRYAETIRDMLCEVFQNLNKDECFLSSCTLTQYDNPIYETILRAAREAIVFISCLTSKNIDNSPWIPYEMGLCDARGLENDVKYKTSLIPVVLSVRSIDDVKRRLSMINPNYIVHADAKQIIGSKDYFESILYGIISRVNSTGERKVTDEKGNVQSTTSLFGTKYNFDNNDKSQAYLDIKKRYIDSTRGCKGYAEKMADIYAQFGKHEYYISRPMLGASKTWALDISEILKRVKSNTKCDIRFSEGLDEENYHLGDSRIAMIGNCDNFILVYPTLNNNEQLAPSSCWIEYGAALAYNINIYVLYQKNAVLPQFLERRKNSEGDQVYGRVRMKEFYDTNELESILTKIIMPGKEILEE